MALSPSVARWWGWDHPAWEVGVLIRGFYDMGTIDDAGDILARNIVKYDVPTTNFFTHCCKIAVVGAPFYT